MWELDHKDGWALKNRCFLIVLLEKTLESSLDFREIHPVHPKGNQSWIFIGRTDAEAETPMLWPSDAKKGLIGKDRPWCLERWKAGGEGGDRGWDGCMASPDQWTWVWVISRSWWWTWMSGMLQSMGSQGQTGLTNWTELRVPRKLEFHRSLIRYSLRLYKKTENSDESTCMSGGILVKVFDPYPPTATPRMGFSVTRDALSSCFAIGSFSWMTQFSLQKQENSGVWLGRWHQWLSWLTEANAVLCSPLDGFLVS